MLLIFSIICGFAAFGAEAEENAYPESEHDYQNNFYYEWYYEYPRQTEGLYVTFSKETSFEEPSWETVYIEPDDGEITVGDVEDAVEEYKRGDYLYISSDNASLRYSHYATGNELSGKTLYIPGNSFNIYLETDESITDFGFKIDRISDTPPESIAVITYNYCESCNYEEKYCFNPDECIYIYSNLNNQYYCHNSDCPNKQNSLICWVDEETNQEYYGEEPLEFASRDFKAKYIPLLLKSDEIFCFNNSRWYFNIDEKGGYYISATDYQMMKLNLYKTFGFGPLPAAALSIVFSTYPYWNWRGSCYGMSATVFLQHYGVIDLLGDNYDSLSEVKATAKVISTINYYQYSAASSFLCENHSTEPGTEMYSAQLRKMFEAVENGQIVLLTYCPLSESFPLGHTVILTGAYTKQDGSNVLIAYDCNFPEDYKYFNQPQRFFIDRDFKTIEASSDNTFKDVSLFHWTSDYTHFEAFDIYGEGNVLAWHSYFFKQIINFFKTVFEIIIN